MAEFALVQQGARTTTGTQDFTYTGFGTPKAAMFFVTLATANDTAANAGGLGYGFTDGTSSRSVAVSDQDAADPSVTKHKLGATSCITILNNDGTLGGEATFSSWITDGVRVNWPTTVPASAFLITCLLIGGSGVTDAHVNTATVTAGAIGTETNITSPNFQPDVVFFIAGDGNPDTSITNTSVYSFGFATRTGPTQRALSATSAHNQATTSNAIRSSTTDVFQHVNDTYSVDIGSFDSQGFSLFVRSGAIGSNLTLYYLAFKLSASLDAKIVSYDSPTSTGAFSVTGVGFTPQFMLHTLSGITANDSTIQADISSEIRGVGMVTALGPQEFSVSMSTDYNAAAANTECFTDTHPVNLRCNGAAFQKETFTAFTSDGITLNASTANGTVRKRFALFIKAGDASLTVDSGSYSLSGQDVLFRTVSPLYLRYRK